MKTPPVPTPYGAGKTAHAAGQKAVKNGRIGPIAIGDDGGGTPYFRHMGQVASPSARIFAVRVKEVCIGTVDVSGMKAAENVRIAKAGRTALTD